MQTLMESLKPLIMLLCKQNADVTTFIEESEGKIKKPKSSHKPYDRKLHCRRWFLDTMS